MMYKDIEEKTLQIENNASDKKKGPWKAEAKRQQQLSNIIRWYLDEYYSEQMAALQGTADYCYLTEVTLSAEDGIEITVQTYNENNA